MKEGGKNRKKEGVTTMSSSKISGTNSGGAVLGKVMALPNEIRITQQGKPRNYITYAMNMLAAESTNEIVLKGMGRAMNKTVMIAEILKRKVPLHQITSIESLLVEEPQHAEEEVEAQQRRYKSSLSILLSKVPLDTSNIGYQPPLPPEEMLPAGDIRPGLPISPTAVGGPEP
jgi:ribonuclease P/MRP protein subunit RPP25